MLHVDILSAYCLCGASALVAAGVLLLAEADDADVARAMRVLVAGFVVLAAGMFPVGWAVDDGSARSLLVLAGAESVMACTALFGWGFARLCGARPPPALGVPVALVLLAVAVAWTRASFVFETVLNASALLISVAVTAGLFLAVGRRGARTRTQNAILASLVLYSSVWAMRCAFTLASDGSPSFHASHVPPALEPWMGVFYGVIPVIIAALTLNLVNERLTARLRELAQTDELTGTLSRRALRERAPELLARQQASGRLVAALMIDIDHFKAVNDRHGHAAGDAVLRRAARLVSTSLRADSVVTRYGGEEFAVLLPVAGLDEARVVAERLRKAFEEEAVEFEGARIVVTISVGLAIMAEDELLEDALKRADAALYRAKHNGRNRVDVALAAA